MTLVAYLSTESGWTTIVNWIAELSESDLKFILRYHNTKGGLPPNDIRVWFFISLTIRLIIVGKYLRC